MLCGARDVVSDNLGVCRDKLSGWSVKKNTYDRHTRVPELLWDCTGCRSMHVKSTIASLHVIYYQ